MEIPDHLTCLLRNLYAGQEATVRTRHGTINWFQLGKEYVKAVYCHPVYLTSMQNTSSEMLEWMNHTCWNQIARKNINNLGYVDTSILMAESKEELKRDLLDKGEEESEKAGLNINIQKTRIITFGPITSWQRDGESMETVGDCLVSWTPKSLQMINSAMKLKDTCSLEEKLWSIQTAY